MPQAMPKEASPTRIFLVKYPRERELSETSCNERHKRRTKGAKRAFGLPHDGVVRNSLRQRRWRRERLGGIDNEHNQ